MATITRLEASRHVSGRFLVFLTDAPEPLLKVTEEEILKFSLHTGQTLDEEKLAALTVAAGRSNAKATAARMVGARPPVKRRAGPPSVSEGH